MNASRLTRHTRRILATVTLASLLLVGGARLGPAQPPADDEPHDPPTHLNSVDRRGPERMRNRRGLGRADQRRERLAGELARWLDLTPQGLAEFDHRLGGMREQFERLESERKTLIRQLDEARSGVDPSKYDPQALFQRQTIERLYGEIHQRVMDQRPLIERAGGALALLQLNPDDVHNKIDRTLERAELSVAPEDALPEETRRRWRAASQLIERGDREGLGMLLFGPLLGAQASALATHDFETIRAFDESPDEAYAGGPLLQQWNQRIRRIERNQEQQAHMMLELQTELMRLRRQLELLTAAGTPAADDGEAHGTDHE